MLILHISDLHFKKGEAGTELDPNSHLRNEIVRDVKEKCRAIGNSPDLVLISGDIAFSGNSEEYKFAQSWLENLCVNCGCDISNIFVVPGNHDVQRNVASRPVVQSFHSTIKSKAGDRSLLKTISGLISDEDSGPILYSTISNFNDFAAKYFCDLIAPNRTKIERRFELNDGSKLCVTGLNSTFVSSHLDEEGSLFVDQTGFNITRENGVVHLVLCHHPCNWLANGRDLEDHLNDVVQIQLFGHEHSNRVSLARDSFRLAASAAIPDRLEEDWEPGYNLLELEVLTEGGKRFLDLKGHVRIWQSNPGQFVPKMDKQKDYFGHRIELEAWRQPAASAQTLAAGMSSTVNMNQETDLIGEDASMTSLRELSIRFFSQTFSKKLEIAGKLSLFEEEDTHLPDHERFRKVLLRACERHLLAELESEIEKAEKLLASRNRQEN